VSARARGLAAALRRRERLSPAGRAALDARTAKALSRRLAVVYTDTDDFTKRVERHGMLHFLMVFARGMRELRKVAARHSGRFVKVEADSLLLAFPDAEAACRGSLAMRAALTRLNRGRPAHERLAFSFGIGYGEVLDLGRDLFGLEVNLASKLGEDRARRGEILLTPGAANALAPERRARLARVGLARFTSRAMQVYKLEDSSVERP
jgi:class 3 adenylate cyclase